MSEQENIEAHWETVLIARAEAAERERDAAREEAAAAREEGAADVADMQGYLHDAQAEIERLNHCINEIIPTEMKWRRRAIAAECVVGPLVDACKAALVPAGDTPAELEAQIRAALSLAERWHKYQESDNAHR